MSLTYEQGLNMARQMKKRDEEIKKAIRETQLVHYGVVALRFSNDCNDLDIEIMQLPYESDVRIYYPEATQ
jgi:hypothetical protein